jgi:hemolysin III
VVSSADSDIRPTWRGWLHAVAFVVAIPAGITLIAVSDRAAARTSATLYVISLTAMFGLSAAYHRLAKSETARRRMQRLDHAGIFLLIAGTYVPITMVAFPSKWGIPVMAVIGSAAAGGIILKLAAFERARLLGYLLYPAMGWTAVVTLPVLVDRLTMMQLVLIVAGGLIYSMGIPVLFLRRPDPWPTTFGYHEIWHGFVVVAASLHFIAVSSLLA